MKYSKSEKLREHYSKSPGFREFRLADQIQRELAKLLHLEVKDPRIGFVTITDVEVSIDLSFAKVFYSTYPSSDNNLKVTQEGLDAVVSFLRSRLGKLIKFHHTPELKFIFDNSLERGRFLSNLIDEACQEPEKNKKK